MFFITPNLFSLITGLGDRQLTNMALEKLLNKYDKKMHIVEADIRDNSFNRINTDNVANIIFCYDPKNTHSTLSDIQTRFTELKNVSIFLKNNIAHKIRVYKTSNPTTPLKIIIFANRLTTQETFLKFMGCIPLLYGLENQEDFKSIFIGISHKDPEPIQKFLKNSLEQTSLNKEELIKTLQIIQNKQINKNIDAQKTYIEKYNREIEEQISTLKRISAALSDAQEKLTVLEWSKTQIKEIPQSLINICTNGDLINLKASEWGADQFLHLHIYQPIRHFDETIAERLIPNCSAFKANFLKKCFVEQTHTVYWHTYVTINLTRNEVYASHKGYDPAWKDFEITQKILHPDSLPNTHIIDYNCWGMNKGLITQALIKGDLETAILQILTATASLSLADNTVLSRMIARLEHTKAIKTPDGRFIDYLELQNK